MSENDPTSSFSSISCLSTDKQINMGDLSQNEKCRVCGKKSAGKHYSVPACHGCKSFFRRATIQNTIYPNCKYNRACFQLTSPGDLPKKCRACRLEKCYKSGMVAIVTTRRKSTDLSPSPSGTYSESDLPELMISSPIGARENYVAGIIQKLHNLDIQTDKFRKSAYNPLQVPDLEIVLASAGKLHLADKLGPMKGWPLSQESFIEQQIKMNEITSDISDSVDLNSMGIVTKNWLSFDMLTALEYAKAFPFFNQLETGDKISLTKATTFMNLALTSTYSSFLSNMDVLQMPDGICISGPVGKNEKEIRAVERRLNLRVMAPIIRNMFDKTEYVLLKAIILCNNAVDNLSHHAQTILATERHNLTGALLLYCLTRLGSREGPSRFYCILNMVDVLEHHQRDFRDYMLLMDINCPNRYAERCKALHREILDY